MAAPLLLCGGRVCTPTEFLEPVAVLVEGDRIQAVGPLQSDWPASSERVELNGAWLAPGLIDTHVHGGLAADTMDATPEALAVIASHLAGHGVTSWLPTTVACEASLLEAVLEAIEAAQKQPNTGARILGAHLESNFLAQKYKGAQPAAHLRAPADAEILALISRYRAVIRIVTLAPELPGALDLIRQLREWGIVVSIGHTDARYDEVQAAVEAGATRVTHLCNAQRPFHHREPGVVGAALVADALSAELIADGVHIHPAGLILAHRCKGFERLILVSDALRGTGLGPGSYELGGQVTHLSDRIATLADGTIAGSILTLERAVANAATLAQIPVPEALAMASLIPARSLGLLDRGYIAPGGLADLAVLDQDFHCLRTMIGGRWVN